MVFLERIVAFGLSSGDQLYVVVAPHLITGFILLSDKFSCHLSEIFLNSHFFLTRPLKFIADKKRNL